MDKSSVLSLLEREKIDFFYLRGISNTSIANRSSADPERLIDI